MGAFEWAVSSQQLWWGPGQFNALMFSHAGQSFPHISFNTWKPAKTSLGDFSGQILIGRLEDLEKQPSQINELNANFRPGVPQNDWRYLNALMLTYQPKWLSQLTIGFTRSFQQYESRRPRTFNGWLPVLEPFQKRRVFDEDNIRFSDDREIDQQATVFARYVIPKAQMELYFEFGKRDHNLDWREFILNPEHARAYLMGFQKLFATADPGKVWQLRGEMLQGSNSINRLTRYGGNVVSGWHAHGRLNGFRHQGQLLGLGRGIGTNVQTLEFSRIHGLDKWGFLLERVENHQDFFWAAFEEQEGAQP